MKTLHLRASEQVMQQLISSVNKLSEAGNDIEILDNFTYLQEQKLISTSLEQIKNGEVYSHEEIWQELLS